MFAATKRLLVTLTFTAVVCGFGISQEMTADRSIRLAVGNQLGSRDHRVMPVSGQSDEHSGPRGLLDRLRAIGGGVSDEYRDSAEGFPEPPPADWTGVPYHDPKPSRGSSRTQPITDPTRTASRRRSQASVAVSPRVSSAASSPATVQVPLGVGRIPTPPAEAPNPTEPASTASGPLSDVSRPDFSPTYSSRRSNRRPVEAMSDAVASPSDRPTESETAREDALAASTRNPVIDVDSDEGRGPQVRQRPVPQRRGPAPRPRVASKAQPSGSSVPSASTAGDAPALAPTPPSLAGNSGKGTTTAKTPPAASQQEKSSAQTAPAGAASLSELGRLEQLQPVGSGVGESASSNVTADSSIGFQQRTSDGVRGSDSGAGSKESKAASGFRSEVPAVRVVAAGPSEIMIRQQTPYVIRVENRGSIDAPGVLVRAQLPNWAKVRQQTASAGEISQNLQGDAQELMWQIEDLPAGATETLDLQLQAEQSGTFEVNVDWTLLPRQEVLQVNVREPKLKLIIEGPDHVTYGESETYRVRVLNPGNGIAPNVVFTLSPNSATPQSQEIGSIPPGKEAEFQVELTAQDLGTLEIHGLATGELALRTEETKQIKVAAAKLEATLSGPPLKYQNGEATYQLQVRNIGSAASERVAASLRLPPGLKYVDGLKEGRLEDETLTWTIDQIAVGTGRDYQVRCQMLSTGTHRLAFQCEGSAAGKAAVAIDTKVEALADLVLSINDPPAPAPVGKEVTYEITIRNRGSKAATAVQAITHFSENIEPLRVEGHSGNVTTGQVEFEPIGRIEAGEEITLRVIAQANREGLHRFRTEISSADTVLVAEEATRFLKAKTEQISRRSSETQSR